ncbi:MAG TPA: hypothetical protein VG435_11040 [Acidimicrobiales bacterium]|jgi:hypothetical protein|nr:hypothetical protein [Acidimicrobiales bacterium]
MEESVEFLPPFDANTKEASPRMTVAIGQHVAVVGSPDALEGCGAATVYAYSEATNKWGFVGTLFGGRNSGTNEMRAFGSACLVVGDTVIIGASGDSTTPGRVVVLTPPYGVWTYGSVPSMAVLNRAEPIREDSFGASLAHCFDGKDHYVAVGAPKAAPPRGPFGTGMVFIFKGLESTNEPWSSSPIANPNAEGTEEERFASSVAIGPGLDESGQPNGTIVLAVAAPGAKEGQGVVYVGATTEAGEWPNRFSFGQVINPQFPDVISDDFTTTEFGTSVAMTPGVLAIGAPADPNFEEEIEGTGAVWLYQWKDGQFEVKQEGGSAYGPSEDARFGSAIAFPPVDPAAPGIPAEQLLVSVPGRRAGAVFDISSDLEMSGREELTCYGGKAGDRFGSSVAIASHPDGPWSIVGAPGDPASEIDGGGYVYAEGASGMKWSDPPVMVELPHFRWFGQDPEIFKRFTPKVERYL